MKGHPFESFRNLNANNSKHINLTDDQLLRLVIGTEKILKQ